jgi:2-dehydropantoate 2-reductase
VAGVTVGSRNTCYRAARYGLTRAGLSPAGLHQLLLAPSETQAIAETLGAKFRVDVERRIEGARKVGAHKTSMLQDLERRRPMEIDPLVTVVQEMGRLTGIVTPALDTVLALVIQRAKIAGLYEENVRPVEIKAPAFA